MSIAARQKLRNALDALQRAYDGLGSNPYDASAKKYARKQLAECERSIKDAREAMRVVNAQKPHPEPEPEEEDQAEEQDAKDEKTEPKEVEHEDL